MPDHGFGGALAGSCVLVVEDEFPIALQLESMLVDEGARVLGPYAEVTDAVACATAADISAAILDVHVGRHSVDPIARILARRQVPFLFYTGQGKDDPIYREWPEVTSIMKPASDAALVDALLVLLRRARPVRVARGALLRHL
ncbi:MAG: response regulator [Alphaproteobacteria bacterium]|nr:response regulator [Alphaproteobacteria bacterium]